MKPNKNALLTSAMKAWLAASPLLMALGTPAHANHHEQAQDHGTLASKADAKDVSADEFVQAEVRSVDRDKGKLVLKHEAIRKFNMNGMTMGFRVADPALIEAITAGDKVRFVVDRVNGQYVITRIEKLP